MLHLHMGIHLVCALRNDMAMYVYDVTGEAARDRERVAEVGVELARSFRLGEFIWHRCDRGGVAKEGRAITKGGEQGAIHHSAAPWP